MARRTRRPWGPNAYRKLPSRLTPRVQGQLAGTALAWAIVLMAWGAHGLRSGPSVVFWLAATALLVYLITGIATVAQGEDGWRAARKAVLLVLLVLVPVTFDPKTFDVFNVTKYNFLAIGGWVLAGLWVIEGVRTKRVPAWRNGLQWPVLFLVSWTVLSTISSVNPRLSLLGAYGSYDGLYATFGFAMVLFAAVEAFRADDVKVALSVFYFGAGGLSVLYGVIQLHDHIFQSEKHWDWVRWGEASFKTSTIWSTMGNPNHLAGLLVTVLPVGVVLFFVHRNWLPRVPTTST